MTSKLTSISTATGDARNGLDALRQGEMTRETLTRKRQTLDA
jgi:hypothetical protein